MMGRWADSYHLLFIGKAVKVQAVELGQACCHDLNQTLDFHVPTESPTSPVSCARDD